MQAFVLLFVLLVLAELLFWGPGSSVWDKLRKRIYKNPKIFYALPAEYIIRIAVTLLVLFCGWSPAKLADVPQMFWGEGGWLSVTGGVVLSLIGLSINLKKEKISIIAFIQKLVLFLKTRPVLPLIYVLVWVSIGEELIFRGAFLSLLSPSMGYGALWLAALANLLWHLPVWVIYAKKGWLPVKSSHNLYRAASNYALQILPLVLLLLHLYYFTGSLVGPVLVHFSGDVSGLAMRQK